MVESAYIHIPFCKRKCNYCSFVSYSGIDDIKKQEYVNNLLREIDFFYKKEPLKTLYLGGGTPSLLSVSQLDSIIKRFELTSQAEVTIEINPETVDKQYIYELKEIGINRISIGVQSFNDEILQKIGRLHSSHKAKDVIRLVQDVGFSNISVDFIYGLPTQTLDMFLSDLKIAIALGVSHISLYGLKIEQGCKFYINYPKDLPDDDLQADMYLAAINLLEENGFEHYEISNFAKNRKYSNHNLNYWNAKEYYGFGVAAHGYVNGCRYSNFSNLDEYSKKYTEKAFNTELTQKEKLEEKIFLGFRCLNGINVEEIEKEYSFDFEQKYGQIVQKYLKTGHLTHTSMGYKFTPNGVLLSNIILSDFL